MSALAASIGAGLGVSYQKIQANNGLPSGATAVPGCVMAVGNFEAGQFNQDSLFLIDTTGAIRPAKGLATVSTIAKVPPEYVNRNVVVCYLNAVLTYTPPTKCVTAVEAFYANERTGNDTLLWVPGLNTPLRDSLARADSLPNGAVLPQIDSIYQAKPIQICFPDSTVHNQPVLKT